MRLRGTDLEQFRFLVVSLCLFAQPECFEELVQVDQTVLVDVHHFAHLEELFFGIVLRKMLFEELTGLGEFVQRDETYKQDIIIDIINYNV